MLRSAAKVVRFATCAVIVALTALVLSVGAQAAAYPPQQQLPSQTIQDFMKNPSQLLTQFPNGGGMMISRVRDLMASDQATLSAILSLVPNANAEQKAALGAALGQAARLYVRNDPAVAGLIQQQVAATNDPDLIRAYRAVAGDIETGGVGGAGGGSTGAIGGQTSALAGTGGANGGGPTPGSSGTGTGSPSISGTASAGGAGATVSP
jgi:hypothetical protein